MRRIGYGLGIAFIVVAASLTVAQLLALLAGTAAMPVSLGSIWQGLSGTGFAGFQAFVEGSIGSVLWTPTHWLLGLPAWLPFGILGILLLLMGRQRGRGNFD